MSTHYSSQHLRETAEIVSKIDPELCEKAVDLLVQIRELGGRLFILGVGGSAANASHAVNDFRKIARAGVLRADGQRFRVNRAHQRRGLGHGVSPNGSKAAGSTRRTAC